MQEELAEDRIAMQPYLCSWVLEQLVETLLVAEVVLVAVVVLFSVGQVEEEHSMSLSHLQLGVYSSRNKAREKIINLETILFLFLKKQI